MGWDIDVKEKVSGRLANEIFFRIYDGTYQPGAKLPSILDIAKEAGSSPETVRKAIRVLQHKGIVDKNRGGFYVTSKCENIQEYCNIYIARLNKEYIAAKARVGK